jgi:hypothetical protein
MRKSNTNILLLLIFATSCTNNTPSDVKKTEEISNVISEDSLQNLISHLKINNPDTFIFLNYWYGMPMEYLKMLNQINIKNKDVLSWSDFSYGEHDTNDYHEEIYFTLHSSPEQTCSVNFLHNPQNKTLESVRLNNSFSNEAKGETYLENGELKHRKIYKPEKEGTMMQNITTINTYLIELLGKNYDTKFDNELSSLLNNFGDLIHQKLTEDFMENTNVIESEYPIKTLRWINNKRYIVSVCKESNKYYNLDNLKGSIIGKYLNNIIIFTHVDYVNKEMRLMKQAKEKEMNKKDSNRLIQKEKI